jgi:hypothetical protein
MAARATAPRSVETTNADGPLCEWRASDRTNADAQHSFSRRVRAISSLASAENIVGG